MKVSFNSKEQRASSSHFQNDLYTQNKQNIQQQAQMQALYPPCQMLSQSRFEPIQDCTDCQPRIKLRDYLFLAKTAVSKAAVQKRKIIQEVHEHNQSPTKAGLSIQNSKAELRRCKYGIEDRQMLQILEREMESQLDKGIKKMQQIKSILRLHRKQDNPSSDKLGTMYKLRTILKDNIGSSIAQMQNMIINFAQTHQVQILEQEPYKSEADNDNQFANLLLNSNIRQFQIQLNHRFSFGKQ